MNLTDFQKRNIDKLIEFIPTIPDELFDMTCYNEKDGYEAIKCNSVGCLIGHAIKLDIDNVINNYQYINKEINYIDWSEYYFTGNSRIRSNNRRWHYLFDSNWSSMFNTKQDAINRVQKLIDNNYNVPYQWNGKYLRY